jgi:hypothetical protein
MSIGLQRKKQRHMRQVCKQYPKQREFAQTAQVTMIAASHILNYGPWAFR